MRIFIIDPDPRAREVLVSRVAEALRRVQLRRVAVVDGTFDLVLENAGGDEGPTVGFLGPGCYQSLESSVARFRSFYPKIPLAAVLDNDIYAAEALELRRYLSARVMPLADIAQMAQFILDSSGAAGTGSTVGAQGVLGVFQFKGGVGASSLATALASCWAVHGRTVALVDFDDVNPLITDWSKAGIAVRRLIGALLARGEVPPNRLKELVHSLAQYDGALSVVPQPELYRESFHLKADVLENAPSSAEFVSALIAALQDQFEVVVVDAGRSWGVSTFALLPLCQHVLVSCDDDLCSLYRTVQNFQRLYRESDDPAEFDLLKWQFALNAVTGYVIDAARVQDELIATDLFAVPPVVHSVPYSESGREWACTAEAGPGLSLYDLGEDSVRSSIEEIAFGLIPFRREESERRRDSFRQRVQKLVSLLG